MTRIYAAALGATLIATSSHAIDACMVGVWGANGADIAQVMAAQMDGDATYISGTASLEITDTGVMNLMVDDMVIEVRMPDVPPIAVTISGYSKGAMNADDGSTYAATAPEYDLVGSADVMGTQMEIPVTSDTGPWGQSTGTYGCAEDNLTFQADMPGSIPPSWTRIR